MAKYPGIRIKFCHGDADGFGKLYTGSSKAKQMKRKPRNFIKFDTIAVLHRSYGNKYRSSR